MVSGGVLAIVGCTVLQEELFHVLRRDPEISRIVLVQGEKSVDILPRLTAALPGKNVISIAEKDLDKISREGFSVLLIMKTTSLHRNPEEFRQDVIDTAMNLKPHIGSLLLFYGLCRNALRKMSKVADEVGLPIMLLTDTEGHEVDDCFGAILGGKRKYLEQIKANHGTLFLTTGYAEHWSGKLSSKDMVSALQAYEDLRFVFDRCGYNRVIRLDTGLGDEQRFKKQVDMFVRTFDMKFETQACDLSVFEHSYELAKRILRGDSKQGSEGKEEVPVVQNDAVPF
jgi:hypothetical protein